MLHFYDLSAGFAVGPRFPFKWRQVHIVALTLIFVLK